MTADSQESRLGKTVKTESSSMHRLIEAIFMIHFVCSCPAYPISAVSLLTVAVGPDFNAWTLP